MGLLLASLNSQTNNCNQNENNFIHTLNVFKSALFTFNCILLLFPQCINFYKLISKALILFLTHSSMSLSINYLLSLPPMLNHHSSTPFLISSQQLSHIVFNRSVPPCFLFLSTHTLVQISAHYLSLCLCAPPLLLSFTHILFSV